MHVQRSSETWSSMLPYLVPPTEHEPRALLLTSWAKCRFAVFARNKYTVSFCSLRSFQPPHLTVGRCNLACMQILHAFQYGSSKVLNNSLLKTESTPTFVAVILTHNVGAETRACTARAVHPLEIRHTNAKNMCNNNSAECSLLGSPCCTGRCHPLDRFLERTDLTESTMSSGKQFAAFVWLRKVLSGTGATVAATLASSLRGSNCRQCAF